MLKYRVIAAIVLAFMLVPAGISPAASSGKAPDASAASDAPNTEDNRQSGNRPEEAEKHTYDDNCPVCKRKARESYFTKKTDEFAQEYPEMYAFAGADNVRAMVRMSLEKGERHNLTADREVNGLRIMMSYLGCDFDVDPMYPWARLPVFPPKNFKEENPESWVYLQKVYAQFYAFYHELAGDNFRNLLAVDQRLKSLKFHEIQFIRSDYEILNTLSYLFPERYAKVPESAWPEILRLAEEKAARLGLDPVAGKAMLAGMMFFLGVSVDQDPLYANIFEGLDKLEPGSMQREYLLYKRLKDYLQRS